MTEQPWPSTQITDLYDNISRAESGTSFPSSPTTGDLFHRTDEDRLYVYKEGTGWYVTGISNVVDDTSPELGGNLAAGNHNIGFTLGTTINEFSIDGTLDGNSDDVVPTEKAVRAYVNAAVPSGIIVMWSGTLATVPDGWSLCDGGSQPDLRDKFIYGWTVDVDPGGTGGSVSDTHTHTVNSHGHDIDHTHTVSVWAGGYTGTVLSNATSWTHIVDDESGRSWYTYEFPDSTHRGKRQTSSAPTLTTSGGATPATGGPTATHLPPYYKMAFIMKDQERQELTITVIYNKATREVVDLFDPSEVEYAGDPKDIPAELDKIDLDLDYKTVVLTDPPVRVLRFSITADLMNLTENPDWATRPTIKNLDQKIKDMEDRINTLETTG